MSAQLFLRFPEFRTRLRDLLAGRSPLMDLVPAARPDPRDFEVVLAVVTTKPDPIALAMPFFSRNHLVQVIADIESRGYRVSIARIDERVGARPPDAGDLYKDRHPARATRRVIRAADHPRRQPPRTPVPAPNLGRRGSQ